MIIATQKRHGTLSIKIQFETVGHISIDMEVMGITTLGDDKITIVDKRGQMQTIDDVANILIRD